MPQIGEIKRGKEIGRGTGTEPRGYYKYIWFACEVCGKERWVYILKGQPKSRICHKCASSRLEQCTRLIEGNKLRIGRNHPRWKGGKRQTEAGYVLIKLYPDDFFYSMADKTHHYVLEHRLIMAKHLGRCLQSWERVHHKDGLKAHNDYDNFELTTNGSHSLEHSKGYRDGYAKGLIDGRNKQIQELQAVIANRKMEN